jgi:tripartite-type tricarboxylate transporter receptor subunit TctC
MKRRSFIACGGAVAASPLLLAPMPGRAQARWSPARPVRIVAGAPGAVLDVAARQIADRIAGPLGQPVVVENKAGAGGIVTMETVARSAPDGHTLAITTFVEMAVNPWLFEGLPYDPVKDFAPVTVLYTGPQLLVAHPSLPASSLGELIRMAKAQPGKFMYGSAGVGRPPHIFAERFKHAAGIDIGHVPYRGGPPLMQAVIAGDVPLAMEGTSATVPQVKAGKLKALAVTGDRRLAALPDVPTFAELGVPGIGLAWIALVAPAGTPAAAVLRLQQEVAVALKSPEIRAAYDLAGRTAVGNTPDEFAALIQRELPEWRDVVRATGLKPE